MTVASSQLRTLARCALAAALRQEQGTLSLHAEILFNAWAEALPFLQKELGESFAGTLADTVARRAVGMLLGEQAARNAVHDELADLLMKDDDIKNILADGDWTHAGHFLMMTAIGAYHAALVKGQS